MYTAKDIFTDEIKKSHKNLKQLKELSDNDKLGCYIITKGQELSKYERMICRILPNTDYAKRLYTKANGRILGTSDENNNFKPFTVKL